MDQIRFKKRLNKDAENTFGVLSWHYIYVNSKKDSQFFIAERHVVFDDRVYYYVVKSGNEVWWAEGHVGIFETLIAAKRCLLRKLYG